MSNILYPFLACFLPACTYMTVLHFSIKRIKLYADIQVASLKLEHTKEIIKLTNQHINLYSITIDLKTKLDSHLREAALKELESKEASDEYIAPETALFMERTQISRIEALEEKEKKDEGL